MRLNKVQAANIIIDQHGSCYGVFCGECPAYKHHQTIGDVDVSYTSNNDKLVAWMKKWISNIPAPKKNNTK